MATSSVIHAAEELEVLELSHNHPLYLQASDTPGSVLIFVQLTGVENYALWSRAMRIALWGKDKLGFVDGSYHKQKFPERYANQWEKCNAVVLSWIMNSVSKELMSGIIYAEDAKSVWDDLKERFDKVNGSRIYQVHKQISSLTQDMDHEFADMLHSQDHNDHLPADPDMAHEFEDITSQDHMEPAIIESFDHITIDTAFCKWRKSI